MVEDLSELRVVGFILLVIAVWFGLTAILEEKKMEMTDTVTFETAEGKLEADALILEYLTLKTEIEKLDVEMEALNGLLYERRKQTEEFLTGLSAEDSSAFLRDARSRRSVVSSRWDDCKYQYIDLISKLWDTFPLEGVLYDTGTYRIMLHREDDLDVFGMFTRITVEEGE